MDLDSFAANVWLEVDGRRESQGFDLSLVVHVSPANADEFGFSVDISWPVTLDEAGRAAFWLEDVEDALRDLTEEALVKLVGVSE